MTVNLLTEDLDEQTVPQKFKDPESGAVRVQALVNSYNELERKLSDRPTVPRAPEEYQVDTSHGLFDMDIDVNKRLFEKNFTPEQVQEVYDLAAEKMVPMIMELANDFLADREVEKLIRHFGGEDKWQEISRQLLAFGQRNLPEDVLNNMAGSYEGVLALYRMMKTEEPGLKQDGQAVVAGLNEKDLHSMMRDPRYWKEKDPAFVSKVTEGFQSLYDEKP